MLVWMTYLSIRNLQTPEAAKLFGFDYKDKKGHDVFDGLTVRVKILIEVLRSADG